MIKEFVSAFEANRDKLREKFKVFPSSYKALVRNVIEIIHDSSTDYIRPDPERIHEIDDGHYQGTLLYVIGATDYQPRDYWHVKVSYGSCSGCDTLQRIQDYSDDVTEEKIDDLMTLALHVVQGLRVM